MQDKISRGHVMEIKQTMERELSNPEFVRLLDVSDRIGKLVFKLEKKYNLPDTDKANLPQGDGCSLVLLEYLRKLIPDAAEIPELETLIKEEIIAREKYKKSKGMTTAVN